MSTPQRLILCQMIGVVALSCAHRGDPRLLHLPPTEPAMNWDELMDESEAEEIPKVKTSANPAVSGDSTLFELSEVRGLENPRFYQNGVYGKSGSSVVFVSTLESIPDWDRLYWVMVRVLSEKYGCFIRGQERQADYFTFKCKDSRSISIYRSRGEDWIQFVGRQYDKFGRELNVKDRQIVSR